ncbi:GGDEF domain-containing protein [Sulfurimonas sp. MAG313]|nr:diguanylate cyclase [Sulfurimonas sp. MAG313]MDF1882280.1 GGDEF domain-containing protein [Sulfurimonas sp. MAG313]
MFQRLLFLLSLIYLPLYAQVTSLDLNHSQSYISQSMLVYEDPHATLELADVLALKENSFQSIKNSIFTKFFTTSTFWFTFNLTNSTEDTMQRFFLFEAPWLDTINVYVYSPNNILRTHYLGNTLTFDNRDIKSNLINISHTFEPGISKVYIQVNTRDPFVFMCSIMKKDDLLLNLASHNFYLGILYGILLSLLLYNLFLFLATKGAYYAYYAFYVLSFILAHASYNNYTYEYLFANAPLLQTYAQSSFIFLLSIAALLFSQSFLNLKQRHPRLNKVHNYIFYSLISLLLFSSFFGGYRLHVILSIFALLLVSIYVISIALYALRKGNKSARLFILGASSGLVGSVLTCSSVMSLIPYSKWNYHALDIGMSIDAILLSLALADKLKIAYQEKEQAQKDSKTDVLTGLLNRRAYDEVSQHLINVYKRYHQATSIILLDLDNFKSFNDSYGHDIGDKVLQHFSDILKDLISQEDYAFRLGGDEFLLILPQINKEQALQLALRLKKELTINTIRYQGKELNIGTSFGISQFQEEDTSIKNVEKRADIDLYMQKKIIY